jgi:hypothetical protein
MNSRNAENDRSEVVETRRDAGDDIASKEHAEQRDTARHAEHHEQGRAT